MKPEIYTNTFDAVTDSGITLEMCGLFQHLNPDQREAQALISSFRKNNETVSALMIIYGDFQLLPDCIKEKLNERFLHNFYKKPLRKTAQAFHLEAIQAMRNAVIQLNELHQRRSR